MSQKRSNLNSSKQHEGRSYRLARLVTKLLPSRFIDWMTSSTYRIPSGPLTQRELGEVYEFWSDIVPDQGIKLAEFLKTYTAIIITRSESKLQPRTTKITARGIFGRALPFIVIRRGVGWGAFKAETIGTDLYISWRVYIHASLSFNRILAWLGICALLTFVSTSGFNSQIFMNSLSYGYSSGVVINSFVTIAIITGLLLGIIGWYRTGDPVAAWRQRLDEFHVDEAQAIGHIMHKSVLATADIIGIDNTQLAPREPATTKQKRRM